MLQRNALGRRDRLGDADVRIFVAAVNVKRRADSVLAQQRERQPRIVAARQRGIDIVAECAGKRSVVPPKVCEIAFEVCGERRPVDTGSNNNRTTVRTLSMQPFFLHHFGTWLETESRYSFDWTQTETDEISDSRTLGESFAFNSGRRFSVFTFSGSLDQNKTIRDEGAPSTKTTNASTNYRLRVHRKFSLLAGVGWQNIDDATLDEEIKGITWDVGFSAQPNSRSSIDLTFGRNFGTDTIALNSSYALSSRTSVTASYSETLTSSDQELTDDLSLFVDDGTGRLVHAVTGEVFDPSDPTQDFRTTLSRQRLLSVGFSASRRRSSYGASFVWNRTEDEATDILSRVMTLSLDYSRTVNSRLSTSLSGSVTLNDPGTDDQREDRTYTGSVSLTYRLMKNTDASLTYRGTATKSNFGENNFHDNTVTLSLSHTF